MNINNIEWTKSSYDSFLKYLYELQDLEYRDFHSKLGINKDYLIGIRTNHLKDIAKQISKTKYDKWIKLNTHKTYEERIIHAYLIGYIKKDYNITINYLNDFIDYIDNWAICDGLCSNLKVIKKDIDNYYPYINILLNSNKIWHTRVGLVLLLNYYINEDYIDKVLDICKRGYIDEYYVNMALAWLISYCYIKFPEKTELLFKNKLLTEWVNNKSIQKIKESYRVSKENKEKLNMYKR